MLTNLKPHQLATIADKLHEHAHKCKKPVDDCKECKRNIAWFAEQPLHVLSNLLREG